MIKYSELVKKTMPPEKRKKASRCIVGHYCVRPICNIVSIPFIEKDVDPTSVTIFSGVFPILALLSFIFLKGTVGFVLGWLSLFIWNVLDGVDGNIARYNDKCSLKGELWDATVGWVAVISFYMGMGFVAFYHPGYQMIFYKLPNYTYIVMGSLSAIMWILPRLVMQKKNVLMGEKAVASIKQREDYNFIKLFLFNITSINGAAAVIFLLAYCLELNGICTIGYFLLSMAVGLGSLFTLLFKD